MATDKNWEFFKNGDQNAFEQMYLEYVKQLYEYGKIFSVDDDLVEDNIQDMFIDLWNKRERLGNVENVKAYLFISLKRRIFKSIKKTNSVISIDDHKYFQAELSVEEILEKTEIDGENLKKLQKAFQNLSKKQQHILYLKYYQGFNNKEITEILQINYQSTRNALNRALNKLKSNFSIWTFLLGVRIFLKFIN